ncbi:ABC transporter permease [Nonomuraea cavernae]|uniref:Monosaccharide-transporting ATPase n=1 Tax=Nonomuraea cavernae TaxID=2045107 RepID=A0A917Z4E1_9ACTN|nr:ABC transporter permease [Nonomuraea cavernae]MCA2188051.1 ABC transporter permease [Nonomuraea cavernae]GGO72667.1 monosaccharide-transporting ATPase [Nonomuraea cavernae]
MTAAGQRTADVDGGARPTGARGAKAASLAYRYGLVVVLVAMLVIFAVLRPAFGTFANALIVLQSVAVVGVVALGVTVSMTTGGFDLSAGACVGAVVMVTALAMVRFNLTGATAIVAGLVTGLLVAGVNALLTVVARVPDLVATLGTMFLFQGLALILTSGQSVSAGMTVDGTPAPGRYTEGFAWLGGGRIGPVPVPVVIFALLAVAVYVLLNHTRWGRALYAIGGNAEAARLAGIRVARYRALAYVVSGLCAAVAGIMLSARLGRGDVGAGDPYLLQSVAAALIGFAVLGANRPNALGTVVGALFIGVMINGMTMLNAPYYAQTFVQGALLVGALVVSYTLTPGRGERSLR